MGCICAKPSTIDDNKDLVKNDNVRVNNSFNYVNNCVNNGVSNSNNGVSNGVRSNCNDEKVVLIEKERKGVELGFGDGSNLGKNIIEGSVRVRVHSPVSGAISKAIEGEMVAAGWPNWLAAVAGEAINGWVPRRADSFEKLDKIDHGILYFTDELHVLVVKVKGKGDLIGQGTYSNVYRAHDLEQKKVVALKKVRFDSLEPESVRFMAREIHILRRLDHPNVIKLEGLVTSKMSCSLYLVFEYMEHDLAGLAARSAVKFTEPQ
ncbi:hypothetical protein KSS87_012539, partial [Heliosperma pusillum]